MKYIVILGDGMADAPIPALDGRTPLEAAQTPTLDALAGMGEIGLVQTVPQGCKPGSETANLAILGYDPSAFPVSRSYLEAAAQGIKLQPSDTVYRCNLVRLSEDGTLLEHGVELTQPQAQQCLEAVQGRHPEIRLYSGVGYRHLCVLPREESAALPPQDCLGCSVHSCLPEGKTLREITLDSIRILGGGLALWFWSPGKPFTLPSFRERTGQSAAMVAGVDVMKGIGECTGMTVCSVPGANGTLDTAYEAKAEAAVQALKDCGFVYVHVEAPDEMGHRGDLCGKMQAIEAIDSRLVSPLKAAMERWGEPFRMLILADHATPVCQRTHTAEPVPYLLYDSTRQLRKLGRFGESAAAFSEVFRPNGAELLKYFLGE